MISSIMQCSVCMELTSWRQWEPSNRFGRVQAPDRKEVRILMNYWFFDIIILTFMCRIIGEIILCKNHIIPSKIIKSNKGGVIAVNSAIILYLFSLFHKPWCERNHNIIEFLRFDSFLSHLQNDHLIHC